LWKDAGRGAEAAEAMKITASDLLGFGVIDAIVPEPDGGAHADHAATARALRNALATQLEALSRLDVDSLVEQRTLRYRHIGVFAG